MRVKEFFKNIARDRAYRWYVVAGASFALSLAFLSYNFTVGVLYKLVWNFSVSFYYVLLMIIKGVILLCENKWKNQTKEQRKKNRLTLFKVENAFLPLIDLALIAPVVLMLLQQKDTVDIGMIPTIAVATYTTFRVIMACVNYVRSKNSDNLALHGLKIISLKEAIVSIITLQNTMVVVFGDFSEMLTLVTATSLGMLLLMLAVSIIQIIKFNKLKNQ